MIPKRHFTGIPVGEEVISDSESENESGNEQFVEKVVNLETEIKLIKEVNPVEKIQPVNEPVEKEVTAINEGNVKNNNEDRDSDSDSDSDNDSDSDEFSEEEQLLKPVFLTKKQRTQKKVMPITSKANKKERTLRTIKQNFKTDLKLKNQVTSILNYAPELDDTDDLDPEAERTAWKLRQLAREKRDREILEREQDELEELEERRLRTEEERELDSKREEEEKKGKKKVQKGTFFQNDDILSREFQDNDIVEVYNKRLLPQRYDSTRK